MARLQEEAHGKSQKVRELEDQLAQQRARFRRQQQDFQVVQRQAAKLRASASEMRQLVASETASTAADLSRDMAGKLQMAAQKAELELVRLGAKLRSEAAEAQQVRLKISVGLQCYVEWMSFALRAVIWTLYTLTLGICE